MVRGQTAPASLLVKDAALAFLAAKESFIISLQVKFVNLATISSVLSLHLLFLLLSPHSLPPPPPPPSSLAPLRLPAASLILVSYQLSQLLAYYFPSLRQLPLFPMRRTNRVSFSLVSFYFSSFFLPSFLSLLVCFTLLFSLSFPLSLSRLSLSLLSKDLVYPMSNSHRYERWR